MRKVLAVVAALLCIAPLFSRETFVVDSYHVDVMVADDSKSTFNEFLDLDFKSPSHGIIRDIQYRFNPRPFVTLSADVSNIMANVESSLSYNDDFLSLRLGSPDRYVFGHVNYHIMYDFLLEDDGNREYDEWYVNLLSPAWDTDIGTFSFSVTFPHEIDPQRIWLTGGSYGSTTEVDYMISSDLRTVSGIVYDLGPYSGVTLRAEFDEGYFSTKAVKKDYGSLFPVLYIIIAGLVIAFVYYSYYHLGRDKEIVSPVRFNPPEGLSSLDVGYIIDGAITFEKDILSMLFYFADKGYMRIKESGDGFTFIKLKEVEEDRPPYERNLFSLLFSTSDQCDMESLARRNFCQKATAKISPDVERYYEKNHPLFEGKSIRRASLLRMFGIALQIVFSLFVSIPNVGDLTLFLLFPSLFSFALSSAVGHKYFSNSAVHNSIVALQFTFLAIIMAALFSVSAYLLSLASFSIPFALLLALFNTAGVFSTSFFSFAVNKRSEYADEMLAEILGYKEFLETVEMDQLRAMIEEDPEFYYHNLSYAIALNLEEKYSAKFKALSLSYPEWYSGFDPVGGYLMWHVFSTRWRRSYENERNLIAPPPSNTFRGGSGSHSGFSGFSGGGFSGGGGRSW